jgi:hypothetical protein
MTSENFKLAVLNALAKSVGGRATLDEVRREVEIILTNDDQTEQLNRFSALGDIDIFQSGLLLRDEAGFQITEAGRSLLQSLESPSGPSLDVSSTPTSPGLKFIDDLIGTEERLKIFDLALKTPGDGAFESSDYPLEQGQEIGPLPVGTPDATTDASRVDLTEEIDSPIPTEANGGNHNQLSPDEENLTVASEPPDAPPLDVPVFLRRSFGSKVPDPNRKSPLAGFLAFVATRKQFISGLWRRHFLESIQHEGTERSVGRVGGAAFAFLSLVVVVTCVGAAIALGQIKSLKSDIALLHREVLALKNGLASLEAEKTKLALDQQEGGQNKSGVEKNKAGGEIRTDQSGLNLSREEVQLIREYIKPAPSPGVAAPAINVGDPVGGATIPLPSQLMEKVPKLLGARFTTRNGAIIIIKRDSHKADAVLPSQ